MSKIQVLDHGYVELIEAWGQGREHAVDPAFHDFEKGIIEAARQSTQGTFRGWDVVDEHGNSDAKLLRRLYTHKPKHATPFEFAGMVLEVQAPIFVFREWHRHRTQSYNEMSARYAPLPDLYYVPTVERLMMKQKGNKQAAAATGAAELTEDDARQFIDALNEYEGWYYDSERRYKLALEKGIPKELARLIMPVAHYSRMRAATNLRNWLTFLELRMHPDAQWEIRQFANAVADIVATTFPRTWELFQEEHR